MGHVIASNRQERSLLFRANLVVQRFEAREIFARKLHPLGFYSLSVGRHWRLISTDMFTWKLLNHGDYDKIVCNRRR